MQRKKPGWKLVTNAEKLRYLILSSVKVYTLRIGDLQLNFYSLDDKNKYISLDASLDIMVSAAQCSQNQRNTILTKKHIKQILYKRIEKKVSYATPKNI